MKNPLRDNIYQATKTHHMAVESVFNFKKELHPEKLDLFLYTMLLARYSCKEHLEEFDHHFRINSRNTDLIKALEQDLAIEKSVLKEDLLKFEFIDRLKTNRSALAGIFYVFAGSSAGANILLSMAKKQAISIPLYYLTTLVDHTKDQMSMLKEVLSEKKLIEDQVIISAQNTFNLIHQIAIYGLQKRNTKFEGTRV